MGKDKELETAVYLWCKQIREDRVPISGKTILGKSLYVYS